MRTLPRLFQILFLAAALTGCAHPAPRAITLPTTAAVATHISKAQDANARAVAIVQRAQKTGLAAGSPELAALVKVELEERTELFATKQANDQLTAQLLAKQKDVDGQTARLASLTTKLNAAEKTIWWYRTHFLFPLILAGVLLAATVAVILLAKFTSWGAKTLGPYLVDAEHLAVKAAVLA